MRNRRLQAPLVLREAFVLFAATLLALTPGHAMAGKFKVLHSFCSRENCRDGATPAGTLMIDTAGNLYGTTSSGNDFGEVFELARNDNGRFDLKVLNRFQGSLRPAEFGSLIIDTQGALYGELAGGPFYKLAYGFGKKHNKWGITVISPSCTQQANCGSNPNGGLTYSGQSTGVPWDGVSPLYGAASQGGSGGGGTVFMLDPNDGNWTETALYNFCSQGGDQCTDGNEPMNVVVDSAGNLFGTTFAGGGHDDGNFPGGSGVVFQLSPVGGGSWTETVLHAFCSLDRCMDGAFPRGLRMDATGNLIGVTESGGGRCKPEPGGCGTVFKLVPNGVDSQETVLYAFCSKRDCRDGRDPISPPLIDSNGNLFGTTLYGGGNDGQGFGGGVAYQLTGTSLKVLHAFCSLANCADGLSSEGGVVIDAASRVYGTTAFGGEFERGVVYQIQP